MARETKAERLAREAQERFEQRQKLAESWTARLLSLLERAQNVGFELRVRDAKFVVSVPEGERLEFTLEYDDSDENALADLEWRVDSKEAEVRAAERQFQLVRAARSKLSKEEREALGLE